MSISFRRALCMASAFALLAVPTLAATGTQAAKAITTLGCYSAPDPLEEFGDWTFQTSGYCQANCTSIDQPVMAITGGSTCYCGDELPPLDKEVSLDKCDTICAGFGSENCGGLGYWQVYLTGLTADVETAPNSTSSTSGTSTTGSGAASSQPAVVTKAGETIFVTNAASTASADASSSGGGDGPNKVGIAVGVVVGVLAVAGMIGVAVLIIKRKRNKEIEEEHRRNAAVSSFVNGKSELSSTDQRLDPSIFSLDSRGRQSIGSIADERDFSRRILQVRNPDRDSKASAVA